MYSSDSCSCFLICSLNNKKRSWLFSLICGFSIFSCLISFRCDRWREVSLASWLWISV